MNVLMLDLLAYTPFYDRYLCMALREQGVEVNLATTSPFSDLTYFKRNRCRTARGLIDIVAGLQLRNATLRRALMAAECCLNLCLLSIRCLLSAPRILHIQWLPLARLVPFDVWLAKMAQRFGVKVAYTVHNVLPHDSGAKYKELYRRIYGQADMLICHTPEAKERLTQEFGIFPGAIRIVPHGLLFHDSPRPAVDEARRQFGCNPGECLVVWHGIVSPYKGINFLLDAWQELQQSGVTARLVIAGTGDQRLIVAIAERVKTLGIENSVTLDARYLSDEELSCYLQAADILVYPYSAITTSGAVMTGLSYAKPMVTTSLPGFQQVFQSANSAAMVQFGDKQGLAHQLLDLIRHPERRRRLAAGAARLSADYYSWDKIAALTKQCYQELLEGDTHQHEYATGASRLAATRRST